MVLELTRRLQSGQSWMIRHEADLDGPDEAADRFVEVLDRWDRMDEEVRGMGFEGCPIGPEGCPDETPARCRYCGSVGGRHTPQVEPEASEGQQRLFPASSRDH